MNYYIFTALVVLAASKSKVSSKNNQTNKERKGNSDGEKVVARKAG